MTAEQTRGPEEGPYSYGAEPLDVEDLRALRDTLDSVRRIREAESVEVKHHRHFPAAPGEAYLLDPDDPFFLGSGSDKVWIVCHPDDRERVEAMVENLREGVEDGA